MPQPTTLTSTSHLSLRARKLALRDAWQDSRYAVPFSLVSGLVVTVVINQTIRNSYDDFLSGSRFWFLMTFIMTLCFFACLRGVTGVVQAGTLLASGLTRREIFRYAIWSSVVFPAVAAGTMVLVALILAALAGDLSGELLLDGMPRGNLWLLPAFIAIGTLSLNWIAFSVCLLVVRMRWFAVLPVVAMYGVVYAGAAYAVLGALWRVPVTITQLALGAYLPPLLMFTSDTDPSLSENALILTTSALLTIAIGLGSSWYLLRRIPFRQ